MPADKIDISRLLSSPDLSRLRDWYQIGPVQRAEVETLVEHVVMECIKAAYDYDASHESITAKCVEAVVQRIREIP